MKIVLAVIAMSSVACLVEGIKTRVNGTHHPAGFFCFSQEATVSKYQKTMLETHLRPLRPIPIGTMSPADFYFAGGMHMGRKRAGDTFFKRFLEGHAREMTIVVVQPDDMPASVIVVPGTRDGVGSRDMFEFHVNTVENLIGELGMTIYPHDNDVHSAKWIKMVNQQNSQFVQSWQHANGQEQRFRLSWYNTCKVERQNQVERMLTFNIGTAMVMALNHDFDPTGVKKDHMRVVGQQFNGPSDDEVWVDTTVWFRLYPCVGDHL